MCRQAEAQVTMYKALNGQLQHQIDDLKRHAPARSTGSSCADTISSEQRLQRIEEAVTRTDAPRSDTLLQLLHSTSEGQVAARAAADAAEAELRSVRRALREAEGQVAIATSRAEDLAQQLKDEQHKSKNLREQSRSVHRLL
jgi:predicted TIM-barrel fold metal-dependent hydrolase